MEVLLFIAVTVGLTGIACLVAVRLFAAKAKHAMWQPALDPSADVHVLGSDFPQDGRDFLSGMVNNRYSVPKDPMEYAKIFVPETKDKGQTR
jgi:hypothetical protein